MRREELERGREPLGEQEVVQSYQANKFFTIEKTVLLPGYLPVLSSFFLRRQRDLGLPQSLVGKFIVYNTNASIQIMS